MAGRILPSGLYALTDPELLPEAVLGARVAQAIAGRRAHRAVPRQDRRCRDRRAACHGVARGLPRRGTRCASSTTIRRWRPNSAPTASTWGATTATWRRPRLLGPRRLIGVSCYDRLELAQAAVAAGADYVAFGSLWPSETKPGAVRAPLELLRQASRELPVPVVAIGGITRDNAAATVAAGAHCVAVLRDLFGDPRSRELPRRYFPQPAKGAAPG
jgi:thiamine-phosphate pyrophosphorylase